MASTSFRLPTPPLASLIGASFFLVQDTLVTIVGVQGPVTFLLFGLGSICLIGSWADASRNRYQVGPLLLLWVFAIWSFSLLIFLGHTKAGIQNVLVWALTPLFIAIVASRAKNGSAQVAARWARWLAVLGAVIYLAEALDKGFGTKSGFPYSARGAGWNAVFAMAIVVPWTAILRWRRWPLVLLALAAALSLSRTPTAICGVLIIALVFKEKRQGNSVRAITMAGVAFATLYSAYLYVPSIHDRFTQGDNARVGGVALNTSGRSELWATTFDSAIHHPVVGAGPGASETLIKSVYIVIDHPHNEYLRIFNDTGLVGLTLWGLGMIGLLVGAVRRFRQSIDPPTRATHLSAALMTATVLLGSITDNITITISEMLPFAVIVGHSLALTSCQRSARGSKRSGSSLPVSPAYRQTAKLARNARHISRAQHSPGAIA